MLNTARCRRGRALPGLLAAGLLVLSGVAARGQELPITLELHKPIFFLTGWDFTNPRDRTDKEIEFQVSIKKRLFDAVPLYFAYTQRAFWQFYDQKDSRPFRTQDHNPELFLEPAPVSLWGGSLNASFGVEHESNGMAVNGSRSWDRAYAWPRWEFPWLEHFGVGLKAWLRFPEPRKSNPSDAGGDDNPDILGYLGHGELTLSQRSHGEGEELPYRRVSLMLRKGDLPGTETFRLDLDYHLYRMWNFFNKGIYFRVHVFQGYGESLMDYNRRAQKIALGFRLQ
jgi:phospholipase A1